MLRAAAAAAPRRGTRIIALSSITGVHPEAGVAVYGASKAALISLVETLNAEESGKVSWPQPLPRPSSTPTWRPGPPTPSRSIR
ncbi:SDR family NAD(P)-dependent oxidoreductase [Streptomyces sp. NPDC001156]